MITLIRAIMIWRLKIKWKLAVWQILDKILIELTKDPDKLEKKIINSLIELNIKQNKEM